MARPAKGPARGCGPKGDYPYIDPPVSLHDADKWSDHARRKALMGGCLWFAGCDNKATTTRPCLGLGDLPVCDRCAEFVDRNS